MGKGLRYKLDSLLHEKFLVHDSHVAKQVLQGKFHLF